MVLSAPSFRTALPWCGVIALLLGGLLPAAAPPRGLWERPVAAQPFEPRPFRPVRVPPWVQETIGVGYTLSGQDEQQRKRARAAGVTISEVNFVDPLYVYYDSKLLHKRSPHVPRDRIDREVAEYRRLGLRILAVYPPTLQGEVYEKHPDWRHVRTPDGKVPEVDLKKHPHGGMLCLQGPYGDFMTDVLCEIASRYRVDAFSFDGLHHAGACYCRHCRDAYRKDAGKAIPPVNLDDPAFRRYQHWADRRLEGTVTKMQARLKAIRPDVALLTWTTNAGRFGHFRDVPRNMPARLNLLFDAPDQEFWLDETNRGATVVPALACAYIWAATNHRVAFSEPYLMSHGNPYGKDSFPAHEVHRRMLLAVAHGAMPSVAVAQPGALRQAVHDGLLEVQKRKPWLTHKSPEPWAAVVVSDNTRVFYGRHPGKVEERYLANVFGTFRAALEAHLPFTLINDWNLRSEDLARYKVLVLPNTACLDEAQMGAIRAFVRGGGGLVATGDTSLCDEFGDPRKDLGLSDVLGASWLPAALGGSADEPLDLNFARNLDERFWQRRKNIFDLRLPAGSPLDTPELRRLLGDGPVTFKGNSTAVRVHGAGFQTAATIEAKGRAKAVRHPAVVLGRFGKGRVVYLPASIDAAYYLYSYPYQRRLIEAAIRWAAAAPPPVEVLAPMCVHSVVMRQRLNGERLLVHLFNDVNTTAFHALPNDDVPLREETLPIHDIKITLRGYRCGRAHAEPGGVALPVKEVAGGLEVVVPRLEVHKVVVFELR